jgi:hypothetical protein
MRQQFLLLFLNSTRLEEKFYGLWFDHIGVRTHDTLHPHVVFKDSSYHNEQAEIGLK